MTTKNISLYACETGKGMGIRAKCLDCGLEGLREDGLHNCYAESNRILERLALAIETAGVLLEKLAYPEIIVGAK